MKKLTNLNKKVRVAATAAMIANPLAQNYALGSNKIEHNKEQVEKTLVLRDKPRTGLAYNTPQRSYSGKYPLVALNAGGVLMLTSEIGDYDRG